MDTASNVQNLDKGVYISHCANTFGKGMNSTILLSIMGEIVGLFSLVMAAGLGENLLNSA